MKKIDAHAHIGEIGGWGNVAGDPPNSIHRSRADGYV